MKLYQSPTSLPSVPSVGNSNLHSAIRNPQSVKPDNLKPTLISFRPYQQRVFDNRSSGIEFWLWARQTGKSFTLAAWAVDRLITRPGRLVTVLSNSLTNGIEFNRRCAEVCSLLGRAFEQVDLSPDGRFESFNRETRIAINGKVGRIKVVAANPRTARGFTGDVIFDEFAFVEDDEAVWAAAEPILASNADFLCRIATTANGKRNMAYRLATDPLIPRSIVTRTDAWRQGCPVYHPITRELITPDQARSLASNKRLYDQNYECVFESENMALLTYELITAAERENIGFICEHNWSSQALTFLSGSVAFPLPRGEGEGEGPSRPSVDSNRRSAIRDPQSETNLRESAKSVDDPPKSLFAGIDIGRHHHRTVITVIEKSGSTYIVRAILRLESMSFPDQQDRLDALLALPNLRLVKFDITGLGLGLFDYTQKKFGRRVQGVNFSSTIELPHLPSRSNKIRITEFLATRLLQVYEDRAIQHPIDPIFREDLRKPERQVSASGRVSIAATATDSGHADHFWSLALALDAAMSANASPPPVVKVVSRWKRPLFNSHVRGLSV